MPKEKCAYVLTYHSQNILGTTYSTKAAAAFQRSGDAVESCERLLELGVRKARPAVIDPENGRCALCHECNLAVGRPQA